MVTRFEHVLPVEMRAVPIRGGARMYDGGLSSSKQPREIRHRRMQREEAIERQRRIGALDVEGDALAQRLVTRVPHWRHGGQSVESATQDDGDEARVTPLRGVREFRQEGPGEQGAGGAENGAEGGRYGFAQHDQRLWNSGDMKAMASPWARLSARALALRVSSETTCPTRPSLKPGA